MRICIASVVVCTFALAVCGCGGRGAEITGRVTLDDQPVERGSILLIPVGAEGQPAGGAIENGDYRLAGSQGPLPGSYRVEIRSPRKSGKMVQKSPGQLGELT